MAEPSEQSGDGVPGQPQGRPVLPTHDYEYIYFSAFPRLPTLDWKVWLAGVAVLWFVLYVMVVPSIVSWPAAQEFAAHVESRMPGLTAAIEETDFQDRARLALAVDRTIVMPLILLSVIVGNVRLQMKHKYCLGTMFAICIGFMAVMSYFYFHPQREGLGGYGTALFSSTSSLPTFMFGRSGPSLVIASLGAYLAVMLIHFRSLLCVHRSLR